MKTINSFKNRQWIYIARPTGRVGERNYELRETELSGDLAAWSLSLPNAPAVEYMVSQAVPLSVVFSPTSWHWMVPSTINNSNSGNLLVMPSQR